MEIRRPDRLFGGAGRIPFGVRPASRQIGRAGGFPFRVRPVLGCFAEFCDARTQNDIAEANATPAPNARLSSVLKLFSAMHHEIDATRNGQAPPGFDQLLRGVGQKLKKGG